MSVKRAKPRRQATANRPAVVVHATPDKRTHLTPCCGRTGREINRQHPADVFLVRPTKKYPDVTCGKAS